MEFEFVKMPRWKRRGNTPSFPLLLINDQSSLHPVSPFPFLILNCHREAVVRRNFYDVGFIPLNEAQSKRSDLVGIRSQDVWIFPWLHRIILISWLDATDDESFLIDCQDNCFQRQLVFILILISWLEVVVVESLRSVRVIRILIIRAPN